MAIELVTETLTNDDVMMMFGSLLDDLVKIALWPPRVRSKEKILQRRPLFVNPFEQVLRTHRGGGGANSLNGGQPATSCDSTFCKKSTFVRSLRPSVRVRLPSTAVA